MVILSINLKIVTIELIIRLQETTHEKDAFYILLCFILAIIGHGYVIYRFINEGVLFTGPNDGMEQMIPMQMYLYDKWSQGQWFYATDFGLGGDFFTDLSYYFSTNILFILNVIFIFLIKLAIDWDTQDIMFWMTNAIVLSILNQH